MEQSTQESHTFYTLSTAITDTVSRTFYVGTDSFYVGTDSFYVGTDSFYVGKRQS